MISPNRIKYAGIFSDELNMPDLIMDVAIDGDNGEVQTFLNRESVASESYDGRYKRIYQFKYSETFSPKFTFFKKDFSEFSMEDVRAVLKWLTSKDTTALLEVYYDDSNVVTWASIGGWIEPQTYKLANNRTIAITATWDSIMPFALSDLYTVTKTISDTTDNKITIEIDTDDNKPVYPRVTIKHNGSVVNIPTGTILTYLSDMVENTVYFNGATYYWKSAEKTNSTTKPNYNWEVVEVDGDYTDKDVMEKNKIYHYKKSGKYYWIDPYYFHSSTTNPNLSTTSVRFRNTHIDFFNKSKALEPVVVKNNNTTEKIVLDGANRIVSSNSVKRIFGDDFNWQWLELYDGKNEITIEGNCEVTLEWREVRKVGDY